MLLDTEVGGCVSKEVPGCSIPNTSGIPEATLSENIHSTPATGLAQQFQAPDSRKSEDKGATQNCQNLVLPGEL